MRTLMFTGSVVSNSIQAGSGNDGIVISGTTESAGNTIDLGVGTDTLRFTATDSDTVTVTNTTITGAKTLIYEKAAVPLPSPLVLELIL